MASEKTADGSELGMDVICRFSGHLAHELNNLLTPIIACGQMLSDGIKQEDPLRFCVDQITDAGERCLGLSRKLQIIGSRRTAGHVMDVSSLCQESLRSVKLPSDRNINLVESYAEGGDLLIKVDMEQFNYLIGELIANAVAAMPQGGQILVSTTRQAPARLEDDEVAPDGWVALVVRDDGTGMSPDVAAKMYEPYFSTHGQERDKGLGLTLVYGIVRRTGGCIECETAPGEGTTFRVFFPLKIEGQAA